MKNGYSYEYDTSGLVIRKLSINGEKEEKKLFILRMQQVKRKKLQNNIKDGVSKEYDSNGNILLIKQYDRG